MITIRNSKAWRRAPLAALSLTLAAVLGPDLATQAAADDDAAQRFAVHGQFTYVEQDTSDFHSPYAGANSLSPDRGDETVDLTLYLGAQLWPGAEGWLDGEADQGFGLDDTRGVAGFPSAEAYKVGNDRPYLRLPRLFIRQTLNFGESSEAVDAAANQLRSARAPDRLVVTFGKFSVVDIFDTSQYAHDPRADFLNWAAIDAGTFDYAADAWGYTVGAALEWYRSAWTLRGGAFDLSTIPNSAHLDPGFHEFQLIGELERRHEILTQPGRWAVTVFDSRGRMGLLDEALSLAQATASAPNVAAVRGYRGRIGASFVFDQQLAAGLGVFARMGKTAGNVEPYEFTDIDRTKSVGLSLQGARWRRAGDTLGLVLIDDEISAERERYLNAGGLGILVGDGRLSRPGPERIVETYYSLAVLGALHLTMDYQWIDHPAYNRDRGPVSVISVRVHAQL